MIHDAAKDSGKKKKRKNQNQTHKQSNWLK